MTASYFIASTWQGWRHGFTNGVAFPLGMDSNASVGLDGLSHTIASLISGGNGIPFIGLNVLLLLSFPMVAVLAYGAVRLSGLRGPLAIALGSAFTFIPFHFGRGIGHVYLGLLFGVAAGIVLSLLIGSGRMAWWSARSHGVDRLRYALLVAALVVITAWTGLYYAFFGMLLVIAAIVWRIGAGDRWRELWAPALTALGLMLAIVMGLIPVLLSRVGAPGTMEVGLRDPMDSVTYAGNLAISLIPQPYSVISAAYNDFIFEVFSQAPQNEAHLMANFGTWVTTAAFITMLIGLVTVTRRRNLAARRGGAPAGSAQVSPSSQPPCASITYLGYLVAVIVPLFVPWGLNYLFAYFATAQVRAWNRLVPYLLLLFLLGAACALASWKWPRRRLAAWTVSLLIVGVTVVDMVLPWRNLYTYVPADGQVRADAAYSYAQEVNRSLPAGCGVLTLPFMPYPNAGPVVRMDDYDHFLIALTNPEHPISYGAYRGSPEAARLEALSAEINGSKAWELKQLGFCGVHVDSYGYDDPAPVLTTLEQQLGAPVAQEGRWTMFRLPR